MKNSNLYIDIHALHENINTIIASLKGGEGLIPVLKANGYGMGAVKMAQAFEENPRVPFLAMAHESEGVELREAGIKKDILILNNTCEAFLTEAVENNLMITLGRIGLVKALEDAAARLGVTAKAQIKIDTGFHRMGFQPGAEIEGLAETLKSSPHIKITGAWTHFADGSNPDRCSSQYNEFQKALNQLAKLGIDVPFTHMSASAASETFPQYNCNAIRVGRRLYMDNPDTPFGEIKEIVRWETFITNIRKLPKGSDLGYGGVIHTTKDSLVGTIGVGYADGLPEAFVPAGAEVLVNGRRCRVLAINMDQSMIDVTDADAKPDDIVTIFGEDRFGNFLSSQEQANLIHVDEGVTITAGLTGRVGKIYIE